MVKRALFARGCPEEAALNVIARGPRRRHGDALRPGRDRGGAHGLLRPRRQRRHAGRAPGAPGALRRVRRRGAQASAPGDRADRADRGGGAGGGDRGRGDLLLRLGGGARARGVRGGAGGRPGGRERGRTRTA